MLQRVTARSYYVRSLSHNSRSLWLWLRRIGQQAAFGWPVCSWRNAACRSLCSFRCSICCRSSSKLQGMAQWRHAAATCSGAQGQPAGQHSPPPQPKGRSSKSRQRRATGGWPSSGGAGGGRAAARLLARSAARGSDRSCGGQRYPSSAWREGAGGLCLPPGGGPAVGLIRPRPAVSGLPPASSCSSCLFPLVPLPHRGTPPFCLRRLAYNLPGPPTPVAVTAVSAVIELVVLLGAALVRVAVAASAGAGPGSQGEMQQQEQGTAVELPWRWLVLPAAVLAGLEIG